MNPEPQITQHPEPGRHLCLVQGDTLAITLTINAPIAGKAWLRTNIGHAAQARAEIIAHVDDNAPMLGRDWFDIPMRRTSDGHYAMVLGLSEVGHFQAKCFLLPEKAKEPLWPLGDNLMINVEPADTCCGNTLYNAFVRLFGPNKQEKIPPESLQIKTIEDLDQAGYTIIPPSGTFRDLISDLDFIVGTLGCRIIQLLPIHPTPTTYARMGRVGSPYAALSFTAVDPALAEFDPKATPLDQFVELVDAVHARNAKIFLDIAINHTGWAASLHATHPHWLVRNPEGEIEVPGAWGVTWADLTRLDYRHKELWQYMADVFMTWCKRGVDGFRCDAGYMVPTPAWQYIIARVRNQFPGTIFLLEGLGGKISVTRKLLGSANFNWAYSELFQNYDRGQIETYLEQAADISRKDGATIHFAETHDNNRLASTSPAYARMRVALCALLSFQGTFGFANGVEWYATEKINVHDATSLNWGAPDNQVDHISRLNMILKTHPVFSHKGRMEPLRAHEGNFIGLVRFLPDAGKKLIALINLDLHRPAHVRWSSDMGAFSDVAYDLLSGRRIPLKHTATDLEVELLPGEALCLTPDQQDLALLTVPGPEHFRIPDQILHQRLRTKVFEIYSVVYGTIDLSDLDPDLEAARLRSDPLAFCSRMNSSSDEPGVTRWRWPRDVRRDVMLAPGHFLLVQADRPFQCRLARPDSSVIFTENSFMIGPERFFALVTPRPAPPRHIRHRLSITLYQKGAYEHAEAAVIYLSKPEKARVLTEYRKKNGEENQWLMLGTNGLGAMMRAHIEWGRLDSRYDGLLAINPNRHYPEDRRMMLTRCRGWSVFQGYSQEIGPETLRRFGFDYASTGCWEHAIPTGRGQHVRLSLCIEMVTGKNLIRLAIYRHPANHQKGRLADDKPIALILRPDIEDRNFHDTTKAFTGPETLWKNSVIPSEKGFVFNPDPSHPLHVTAQKGRYVHEPEWQYMVHRKLEKERGLDPDSDLFSPGYFSTSLLGGDSEILTAMIPEPAKDESNTLSNDLPFKASHFFEILPKGRPLPEAMKMALDHYIVKREDLLTVIAGYPWFLDWGRDTLIVTRGLIAAGKINTAKSIIKQFARFEKDGTIPNMIHGNDTGNRDTSDAPLWLLTVCADLASLENSTALFEMACGGRSLKSVLMSLVQALMAGTPNGIKMDPDSGLLFSPAHFTWMDTNHPAGTPRQGYPIEIQALWHSALTLMSHIDTSGDQANWQGRAEQVRQSIREHFYLADRGYLSDCLHADPWAPAKQATPDNALRPNQLLAITLNAVTDRTLGQQMLDACEALLVPGAIRSLADQPVHPPLEIRHNGHLIGNPEKPYQGIYDGDEDISRKPAYHNGTAWTWLFPSYCEAWYKIYGDAARQTARAWLASSTDLINTGCVGHVPEILDGDAPHRQRGCDAQAWGVSELLRVWTLLES